MRKIWVGLAVVATVIAVAVTADEGSDTKQAPIASSAEEAKPIEVGATVPDVVVQDGHGKDVKLKEYLSGTKSAVIFYRGGWCPFCNKHLSDIASLQDEIAAAGYQVVGINADSPEDTMAYQEKGGFAFSILSDSDLAAARAFGVAFKLDDDTAKSYAGYGIKLMDSKGDARYSLPVPAFYLVDADGKITFEHHDADYKKRISKEDILKAIHAN